MAKIVGRDIPQELAEYIGDIGRRRESGVVVLLISIDEGGWPHVAMLSLWEVVLKSPKKLVIATYSNSTTTRNLRERRLLTMAFIDRGMAYYVKGTASMIKVVEDIAPSVATFQVDVSVVMVEEVAEEIESGISYRKIESRMIEDHRRIYNVLLGI